MLIYWFLFADSAELKFQNCKNRVWFPILYFVYVMIKGHFFKFYPYPFINISEIGYLRVLINFLIMSASFLLIMGILIFGGHKKIF